MTKRIITTFLALVTVLSTFTVTTNANAVIHSATIEVLGNNLEVTDTKNSDGNAQYSISEAPVIVERDSNTETSREALGFEVEKRVIDPEKPMVAITYDDGPSQYTPEILDILKENNSAATFFVLGQRVGDNKDVLNRMIEEGSQIGNHSYNHKDLTKISDEELYKQIQGTDDLVYAATGYTPSIMRPPYGSTSDELNKKIQRPIIKWSVDTRDWESRNSDLVIKSVLDDVKDGSIVLMHDLYDSTLEASKSVIPELVSRGYQLVTVEELFEYRGLVSLAGDQYYHLYKWNNGSKINYKISADLDKTKSAIYIFK